MADIGRMPEERESAKPNPSLADFSVQLTHPHHRQMFDYWRGKFVGTVPPSKAVIDPIEIPSAVLPWVILYTVHWVSDRPRFQFRLVGTGAVQRYNRDSTGKYFEDVYDSSILAKQIAAFSEVARQCRPAYARLQLPVPGRDFVPYERLLLPLAGAEEKVEAIIAVMAFTSN